MLRRSCGGCKNVSRMQSIILLFTVFIGTGKLPSQQPEVGTTVLGKFSAAQLSLISESRRAAYQEIGDSSLAKPDIAVALESPYAVIAIAEIVGAEPSNNGPGPGTRIRFHVEQFLRGESELTEFEVESQRTATPPTKQVLSNAFAHQTVLDRSEAKVGNRYILGYSPAFAQGKSVHVDGAIDLQEPSQASLIADMEAFLAIESAAGESGFVPYLEALDSSIPWIQDIAVHRLSESDACNISPECAQRFSAAVHRQLQSTRPAERLKAIFWIVWVDSISRSSIRKDWPDGLPILRDSTMRALLTAELEDPNLYVGDEAFNQLESSAFQRARTPGSCIDVIPPLRRSIHWSSGEQNPVPSVFPLTYSQSCLPTQEPSAR